VMKMGVFFHLVLFNFNQLKLVLPQAKVYLTSIHVQAASCHTNLSQRCGCAAPGTCG
jgi:hypothetical protein